MPALSHAESSPRVATAARLQLNGWHPATAVTHSKSEPTLKLHHDLSRPRFRHALSSVHNGGAAERRRTTSPQRSSPPPHYLSEKKRRVGEAAAVSERVSPSKLIAAARQEAAAGALSSAGDPKPSAVFLSPQRRTDLLRSSESFNASALAPGYYDRPLTKMYGTLASEVQGPDRLSSVFLAPGRAAASTSQSGAAGAEVGADEDDDLAEVEGRLAQLDPRSAEAVAMRGSRQKLVRQRRAIRSLENQLLHVTARERAERAERRTGAGSGVHARSREIDLSPSSLNMESATLASRVARAVEVPSTEKAIRSLLEDAGRQERLKAMSKPLAESLIEMAEIATGKHHPCVRTKKLVGPHAHGSLSLTKEHYS